MSGAEVRMLDSVHRAGRVLSMFTAIRPEWGVSELALELGVAKSSAHVLLATLSGLGLVRRSGDGRYRLGWRIFELSHSLVKSTSFLTVSGPVLQACADRFDGIAHIAALHDGELVVLDSAVPPAQNSTATGSLGGTGATMPASGTALGAALSAFGTGIDVRSVALTATAAARIRIRGYAYDVQSVVVGLCCVAAPIRDATGMTVAAVGLAVGTGRFRTEGVEVRDAVVTAASELSWELRSDRVGA